MGSGRLIRLWPIRQTGRMREFGRHHADFLCDLAHCGAATRYPIFPGHFQATGHGMTRFAAAILLGLGLNLSLGLCVAGTGQAQDSEPADRCFPWQEFRNGACVAKPIPLAPAPLPAAPAPSPPPDPAESSATTIPLVCPPNSHVDGGACITDASPAPPRALITCNGGTASNGHCTCPAGFELMPAGADPGGSGTTIFTGRVG